MRCLPHLLAALEQDEAVGDVTALLQVVGSERVARFVSPDGRHRRPRRRVFTQRGRQVTVSRTSTAVLTIKLSLRRPAAQPILQRHRDRVHSRILEGCSARHRSRCRGRTGSTPRSTAHLGAANERPTLDDGALGVRVGVACNCGNQRLSGTPLEPDPIRAVPHNGGPRDNQRQPPAPKFGSRRSPVQIRPPDSTRSPKLLLFGRFLRSPGVRSPRLRG